MFAHEAAHILSDHQLYRTALAILVLLTRSARLPLPLAPVRTALMEWGRATELSADRAAALVTRDPLAVCRTLMSIAAGAMVDELDLDVFMRQGMDYVEEGGGLERLTRLMLDLGVTHPMPVKRTHELMAWVRSGEFDRIVGSGEYPRRGEPVDARADGGEAVSFYAERIRDALPRRRRVGQLGRPAARGLAARRPRRRRRGRRRSRRSRWARTEQRPRACSAGAGAPGERHRQAHHRARARRGRELELAADQLGALAHPGHAEAALQAVAARAEAPGVGQALAVVGDRRDDHRRRAR